MIIGYSYKTGNSKIALAVNKISSLNILSKGLWTGDI